MPRQEYEGTQGQKPLRAFVLLCLYALMSPQLSMCAGSFNIFRRFGYSRATGLGCRCGQTHGGTREAGSMGMVQTSATSRRQFLKGAAACDEEADRMIARPLRTPWRL
jgi:hypothetical protein